MKHFYKLILLLSIFSIDIFNYAQQAKHKEDQYTINKKYYELLEKGKEPSKSQEEEYLNEIPKDLRIELIRVKKIHKKSYFRLLKETWNLDHYFTYALHEYPFKLSSSVLKSNLIKQEFRKNIEIEILKIQYDAAKESEKREIRIRLKKKLNELFEIKGKMKKEEINFLESKLKELKVALKDRQKNKNEIIDKKLKEILNENVIK